MAGKVMSESDRCRFKSWDISAPYDVGKAGSWSPGDPVGNSVFPWQDALRMRVTVVPSSEQVLCLRKIILILKVPRGLPE